MKAKTIKSVLRKKFTEFIETIDDPKVRKLVEKNTIITGGSIASMLLREKVNDYDLYFTNHETTLAVAKYYVKKFKSRPKFKNGMEVAIDVTDEDGRVNIKVKSAGVASNKEDDGYKYFEADADPDAQDATEYVAHSMSSDAEESAVTVENYEPVFLSSNAITLSGRVQIILRFYGDATEIHKNFDFVHCTNYWTSGNGELVLKADALEALLTKELRYIGSLYPICSIIRLRKFIKRDFTINAGQILKMCFQISKLDLSNPSVLEDQLTGVDVAYFHEVIRKMKEKEGPISSAYLTEIIDRMF